MAPQHTDLIPMAAIARLADQSRATVGNWKARHADFPPERGRSPRGPLYDRSEVLRWLEATGRLGSRPPEVDRLWNLAEQMRGELAMEEVLPFLLVLLAVRSEATSAERHQMQEGPSDQLEDLLRSSVRQYVPFAAELVPQNVSGQLIAGVLSALSQIDSDSVPSTADALLELAPRAIGGRGGEYLCPPSVRKLIVEIAGSTGSVYNPATGAGQLLVDTASASSAKKVEIAGQEVNARVWAMAQLNLRIHGLEADIALGDVFLDDAHADLRADRVIAVPPWNQKIQQLEGLADDPRWVWGEPGVNDGNAAWIQHCLHHLADEGRAVLVCPNGVQFEGGRAGRIRQRIIKAGLLDAVIALPTGIFPWTSLPCSVLVFVRGRPDVDGKPAPTLMVDLSDDTQTDVKRSVTLEDSLIEEVAGLYKDWATGTAPTEERAAVAEFEDLAANDFVIDPGRYIALPAQHVDPGEISRKKAALIEEVDRLLQVSQSADEQLQSILSEGR